MAVVVVLVSVELFASLKLHAAVLVVHPWRVARREEGGAVVHRDGVDGDAAGGLAPREEEVAGGAAVGHHVVRGEAHGEGPAREPRDLDHHHLRLGAVVVGARVEARHPRRRLQRHDAVQRHVGRRLDEPRARVVEQDGAVAVAIHAEAARPLAVLGQRLGEARLEDGVGRSRRAEGVYDGDVRVKVRPVEHTERHNVGGARSGHGVAVHRLHGLG
ncbi:Os04g0664666 [Oryza sativa Japonica Group]|uniref:Os04g0664666 protein n=1 Tax=Oryza sativa subsp. japonica TaxID=39947 RepID=A0A0P0WG09_ORYSJ|nr:hypothetical protein EE612_026114 [Oryza sativa]BAS91493.1 Os04g0664666 [Oryza sativa Japonica Group]